MIVDQLLHILHDFAISAVGSESHLGKFVIAIAVGGGRLRIEHERNSQQSLDRRSGRHVAKKTKHKL